MQSREFKFFIAIFSIATLIVLLNNCRPAGEVTSNVNANANANANLSANANTNTNASASEISTITAREPDKYRATISLSAETEGGDKAIGIPTLSAQVTRSGADRRVAFKLPDQSDLIYVDKDNHHYVILPARKQYAELTPEAVGFQIQKLMTPGQIVSHLQNLKGVERIGEEQVNGRPALKYRYQRTVTTQTQAGEVKNDAYVYIDHDTGLPLRTELFASAAGDVKGVKSAKIVAEMTDIKTDVDPSTFEIPAAYSKIPPEQIRQHVDAFTNTVAAVIKALLTNLNVTAIPTPSPAATATPK